MACGNPSSVIKTNEEYFEDSRFVHRMVFNGLLHEQMTGRVGLNSDPIQKQIHDIGVSVGFAKFTYSHDLMMEFIGELEQQYSHFRTYENVKALKLRLDKYFLFLLFKQMNW